MKITVEKVKFGALKAGFVVLAVVVGFVLVTSLDIANPDQAMSPDRVIDAGDT